MAWKNRGGFVLKKKIGKILGYGEEVIKNGNREEVLMWAMWIPIHPSIHLSIHLSTD